MCGAQNCPKSNEHLCNMYSKFILKVGCREISELIQEKTKQNKHFYQSAKSIIGIIYNPKLAQNWQVYILLLFSAKKFVMGGRIYYIMLFLREESC